MRRASFVIALLLAACAGTETDKPKDGGKDEASAKVEPEADTKSEAKPDPDAPPPGVKIHGNLPVKTESELAAEDKARDECVAKCVEAHAMEAKGADAIEADCRSSCMSEHPIEQVEVVLDRPPGLD